MRIPLVLTCVYVCLATLEMAPCVRVSEVALEIMCIRKYCCTLFQILMNVIPLQTSVVSMLLAPMYQEATPASVTLASEKMALAVQVRCNYITSIKYYHYDYHVRH